MVCLFFIRYVYLSSAFLGEGFLIYEQALSNLT